MADSTSSDFSATESIVHRVSIPVRWSDYDRNGHLNNAVYVQLAEESRFAFARDAFPRNDDGEAAAFFVRHLEVDYLKPVLPAAKPEVQIATKIIRVGTTSMTARQEIYDTDGELTTVVESVLVAVDTATARPREITRRELQALMPGNESARG